MSKRARRTINEIKRACQVILDLIRTKPGLTRKAICITTGRSSEPQKVSCDIRRLLNSNQIKRTGYKYFPVIENIIDNFFCAAATGFLKQQVPNDFIDLIITSPPYDNLRTYNGHVKDFDFEPMAVEISRVLKPGGVLVWVVNDATIGGGETGTSFRQALYFIDTLGLSLHDTMIYQKTGTNFPSKIRYNQIFEYMFVFSKGKPTTFNPICDVEKKWAGSWGKKTRRRKQDGSFSDVEISNAGLGKLGKNVEGEAKYGFRMRDNVWIINNGRGFGHKDKLAYEHPATFPEQVATDHILTWSNPGDIVLDPMVGSGTTCVAAKKSGRKFIGIDINQEYIDLCERRLLNV